MKPTKQTELRELSAWIEKHVFGRKDISWGDCFGSIEWDSDKPAPRNFTTDPAASRELEKNLLENHTLVISKLSSSNYEVAKVQAYDSLDFRTVAETLELALAQFALKLYS